MTFEYFQLFLINHFRLTISLCYLSFNDPRPEVQGNGFSFLLFTRRELFPINYFPLTIFH